MDNKSKIILLASIITLSIIISGCTDGGQDITPIFESLPEVQQFLQENPNSKITVTYWTEEEVIEISDEISIQCDKNINPRALYKATISEGDSKIISWIDAETQIVICTTSQGFGGSTSTPTATATSTATATPTPPPGDFTQIVDINTNAETLSGQEVKVSAVVVKNVELIDEYFLTLDDGTGQLKAKCPNTFTVSQGDSVVVTGRVMTDVDLGSGYIYEVLLQITNVESEDTIPTPTFTSTSTPTATETDIPFPNISLAVRDNNDVQDSPINAIFIGHMEGDSIPSKDWEYIVWPSNQTEPGIWTPGPADLTQGSIIYLTLSEPYFDGLWDVKIKYIPSKPLLYHGTIMVR